MWKRRFWDIWLLASIATEIVFHGIMIWNSEFGPVSAMLEGVLSMAVILGVYKSLVPHLTKY